MVDDNGVGFRYSFSALKDRHTAVEVNYTDPQNGWQTSTELVEDPEAILRYGRNLLKMDAFGCTSRGQAHRAGLWVIKTGLLETQTVDFTLGSQGLNRPGFPGECFICELRLPDHRFRWKHNKLFLLLPEEYGPAFPAIVDCYTSPPTLVWPVPLLHGFSSSYGVLPPLCKDH